ncbi:pilus assembly protein [Acinetobacter indicus]|uniref:pilus assembly protein n=1 Tax=Acinetobacter indicus TaxID=756892 RepID=UPI001D17988F|nr:PilC/PilY family type IV pilus protein [Acinetobacter indicus]
MKNSTQMKKKWMQFKVSALSAFVTVLIVSGIPTQISASDIDIYQAGGTGGVNIYLMLDASASMESMSLGDDYKYTTTIRDCNIDDIRSGYTYTQNSSGDRRVTFLSSTNGTHDKVGNNYIFVGIGGGYKVGDDSRSGFGTRYDRTTRNVKVGTKCENITKNFCSSNNTSLNKTLKIGDYVYARSTDKYCLIKESDLSLDNPQDVAYLKKIKRICEEDKDTQGHYNCLTRLSILKKGLYSLILDQNINEDIYFALGTYKENSATTHASFIENGKVVFRSMDSTGKATLANAIQNINTGNGTPIAKGYNTAVASHYNKVNKSSSGNVNPECSGNGVYLLTDGVPQGDSANRYAELRDNSSDNYAPLYPGASAIDTADNPLGFRPYWRRVAGSILHVSSDKAKSIKTAMVGFGGMYYKEFTPTEELLNKAGNFQCSNLTGKDGDLSTLCYLGEKSSGYGKGGFYTAQSTQDLMDSILQFVSDVSVEIEGSTMGTSTIPVDALDSTKLQKFSYFPMFKPIVGGDEQLWAGNLKKFAVKIDTGTVVDKFNNSVFKDGKIQEKLSDYWYESVGSSDEDVYMAWGGLLSKLKVDHKPLLDDSGNLGFNRNVYLDIGVNNGNDLKHAVTNILEGTVTLNNKHYLYGLLGYSKLTQSDFDELAGKSYDDQVSYLQTKTNTQNFQMGSVIHSTPIMLTQRGEFEEVDGEYGVTKRQDYILAGTTQGLVQVVDADTGEEVFSFLPSEFLTRQNNSQEKGFAESLAMGRFSTPDTDNFFYGVDGPWVAHTEYQYSFEGDKEIMTAKKQYAYGGLRMGGRSYYALDLTNLGKTSGKPKLLFAIKPDSHTSGALSYMGESWSKPVITYIPWKGQKKLAMIVGGGYDRKYESQNVTGTVKGNGIYIFAAEDLDANTKAGTLLWWGSSNATNSTSSTKIDAMTHSIPSRVKAIDRNGDGITDHLYVGDLGGQVFRVDFNSKLGASAANTTLVHQATKIADLNTSGKIPRRFYEAPTFTIHKDDTTGKRFAMVTLASGDRSSPLMTSTDYPQDYVVAIKDDTITTSPVGAPSLINLTMMHDISGEGSFNKATHKGWFYPMPKSDNKQVRGMEEGIALDNDLYYSLFNPNASTATESGGNECTGGITGKSSAYKFCLPYGDKTCFGTTTSSNPENIGELGAGIIGLTLGAGRSKETHRTLIFNKDVDPKPTEYAVTDKLVPKRWFEYLPFNSGGS